MKKKHSQRIHLILRAVVGFLCFGGNDNDERAAKAKDEEDKKRANEKTLNNDSSNSLGFNLN